MLRVTVNAGRARYPANQFSEQGRPFPIVADVIEAFAPAGVSAWAVASFLASPQRELGAQTPAGWLRTGGDPALVGEAARRVAARLAH